MEGFVPFFLDRLGNQQKLREPQAKEIQKMKFHQIPNMSWICLLLLLWSQWSVALVGLVVGVHDGDTLTVLSPDNIQHKIRLAQIDAPELSQDWGKVSKQALSDLVFKKRVTIEIQSTDRYGRLVGKVYQGETDIGRAQIKAGMAWVYVNYNHDPTLVELEKKARSSKRGLWSMPQAQEPWSWRKSTSTHKRR